MVSPQGEPGRKARGRARAKLRRAEFALGVASTAAVAIAAAGVMALVACTAAQPPRALILVLVDTAAAEETDTAVATRLQCLRWQRDAGLSQWGGGGVPAPASQGGSLGLWGSVEQWADKPWATGLGVGQGRLQAGSNPLTPNPPVARAARTLKVANPRRRLGAPHDRCRWRSKVPSGTPPHPTHTQGDG